jgi:hypothetical protein
MRFYLDCWSAGAPRDIEDVDRHAFAIQSKRLQVARWDEMLVLVGRNRASDRLRYAQTDSMPLTTVSSSSSASNGTRTAGRVMREACDRC